MKSKSCFIFILFYLTACRQEEAEFSCTVQNSPLYLDYAASWNQNSLSLDEFINISILNGNSSGINSHAKYLKTLEEHAAKIIANKIQANSEQIHFTSGATIANNIAILGVAYKNPKCHLITSKIEHKSVLNVFKYLEKIGYKVTYLNVDNYGNVDLKQLRESIQNDTKLISIQMCNSEIGVLQDIKSIGLIARQYHVLFHTDAAQSFCKYDINVNDMNIDLLTMSGHKIGASKGIGALYVRDATKLQPIIFGSGDDLFSGTKPTPLVCSFANAVECFSLNHAKIHTNFNAFVAELSQIERIYINSTTPSHIVSISIEGVLINDILDRLQEYSFSAGCSCLGSDKSNVIAAIDTDDKLPSCTIRVSFSDIVEKKQLIDFAKKLKITVDMLRQEKSVGKGCQSIKGNGTNNLNHNFKKIQILLKKEKSSE